jgi:hypothetical protein
MLAFRDSGMPKNFESEKASGSIEMPEGRKKGVVEG